MTAHWPTRGCAINSAIVRGPVGSGSLPVMRCQKEGSEGDAASCAASLLLSKPNISLVPCQAFRVPAEILLAPAVIGAKGETAEPSALVGHFGIGILGTEIFGIVILGSETLGQLTGKNPPCSSPVFALPAAVCTPSLDVGKEALMI